MNLDRELKRHFVGRLIDNGRRVDGRALDEIREISIDTNVISEKAEGSARVKLGNSDVLCGIKLGLGTPYPDNPNEGTLSTGAELVPIAAPDFEMGRPGEDAIELARVVDRGIRESQMIDLEKLCIEPGEKIWMVSMDIHVLNHDGNLIDASSLAAVSALNTAWVPKIEDDDVVREKSMDLPITTMPISFTSAKLGEHILLDPMLDEEFAMDSRFTVTVADKTIHAMQKGGGSGAFSPDEISGMLDTALSKYKGVKKLIK